MNYGKRSTSKKRNALISRTSMLEKRAHVSFIRVLFTALIAVCVMVVCLGIGSFRGVIAGAPHVNDVDISPLGYATFLYDDQGTQMRQLSAPTSNRLPVSLEQIPVNLQHAVVAIEDERFYEHNGIDVRGIARAAVKAITTGNFSEGASTITQQLLKNNVFTDWTNESTQLERFTRKFQEQYLAVEIEKKYNKDVILENYLNTINLGAGSYGVQAASKKYFNKDVWDLNLSECATLAGITQNPTKFNPITNPKSNSKRRKEVLDHMLDQKYISQDEYNEALNDDVYTRIQTAQLENTEEESTVYTYFEDEVTNQVINDLMNIKGYSKTQATNLLYSGGLKIMTTLDSNIQQILNEEYADPDNYPADTQYELDYALTVQTPSGEQVNYSKEMLQLYFRDQDPEFDLLFSSPEEGQQYVDQYKANILADGSTVVSERVNFAPQPQSSMTVIDQHTGYVKALIGGRGEKTASLTLNRATDTTRQPGSTFKIVSTMRRLSMRKVIHWPLHLWMNHMNILTVLLSTMQAVLTAVRQRSVKRSRTPSMLLRSNAWSRSLLLLALNIWMISDLPHLHMELRQIKMPTEIYGVMPTLQLHLAELPTVSKILNSVPHMQLLQTTAIILSRSTIHRSLTMTAMFSSRTLLFPDLLSKTALLIFSQVPWKMLSIKVQVQPASLII